MLYLQIYEYIILKQRLLQLIWSNYVFDISHTYSYRYQDNEMEAYKRFMSHYTAAVCLFKVLSIM